MFGFFSKWLQHRCGQRSAVEAAVRHFDATTGKHAHPGISGVIGEREGNFVVRICYGNTKPPGRTWYVVGSDGSVIEELSFEEAKRFDEKLWR